jgi:hypothetical protein
MQAGPELIFQLGYYPWVTQNKPPENIRSLVELFASTFEKELLRKLARAKVVGTDLQWVSVGRALVRATAVTPSGPEGGAFANAH